MAKDIDDGPALFGVDLFGEVVNPATNPLRARFVVPPFSTLDARSGEWQGRKSAWLELGIKSEVGRGNVQSTFAAVRKLQKGSRAAAMTDAGLKKIANFKAGVPEDAVNGEGDAESWCVSSIFDPVLCECCYRWFCPVGGQIVDPFAGGSVRGLVAGALGRRYWGCDLRSEQIAANIAQLDTVQVPVKPQWVCGDSRNTLADAPEADFVFSCPPYGDLEVYSDDPADISGYDWNEFVQAYTEIIIKACGRLKDNRFACFVVGDFRDKDTGCYRNFPGGTISSFKRAGLGLYNEAILSTMVGTASLRATKQFDAGRKLVKTHQNVLVFVKGDGKKATEFIRGAA